MDAVWFLVGVLAGFFVWNLGYSSGKIFGKEQSAYEILQFLAWMEPVDRLEWKIKMRAYAKHLQNLANSKAKSTNLNADGDEL